MLIFGVRARFESGLDSNLKKGVHREYTFQKSGLISDSAKLQKISETRCTKSVLNAKKTQKSAKFKKSKFHNLLI